MYQRTPSSTRSDINSWQFHLNIRLLPVHTSPVMEEAVIPRRLGQSSNDQGIFGLGAISRMNRCSPIPSLRPVSISDRLLAQWSEMEVCLSDTGPGMNDGVLKSYGQNLIWTIPAKGSCFRLLSLPFCPSSNPPMQESPRNTNNVSSRCDIRRNGDHESAYSHVEG